MDDSRRVTVNQRGAARLRGGHVWVYRSDLVLPTEAAPGALVQVRDERGKRLGSALYSGASQIAIRLLSSDDIAEGALPGLLRARIASAVEFRRRTARDTDSYRVIFSEADLLPGLIVDKYNDVLAMQALTQAFDREDLRQVVLGSLSRTFSRGQRAGASGCAHSQAGGVAGARIANSARRTVEHRSYAERRSLSLRRAQRAEDRGFPRPAGELRRRGALRSRRGARRLHLSRRLCAALGAGVRQRDGCRLFAAGAGSR